VLGARATCHPDRPIPAVASEKVNYVGNLSADWGRPRPGHPRHHPDNPPDTSTFNMSKAIGHLRHPGRQAHLTQYFARTGDGWHGPAPRQLVDVHYVLDGVEVHPDQP
jgi:flagellar hook protein FlgE